MQGRTWTITDFEMGPAVGKGRFGSVFLCREKVSGKPLAIKVRNTISIVKSHGRIAEEVMGSDVIPATRSVCRLDQVLFKEQLEDYGVVHQLRHEIEIHTRIIHPNVVRCYGYFEDEHRGADTLAAGSARRAG